MPGWGLPTVRGGFGSDHSTIIGDGALQALGSPLSVQGDEDHKLPLLRTINRAEDSCIRNHYMQTPSPATHPP
ncbi:hypothetical protein PF005_g16161 [Phytophthora fragariae]|uniref:Uncharacterized protein n=1 Tax=Phytophthora fragariae TaxID=53985 RepID=A0A6A3RWY2_9STRA|nr:hypothetical protein PF007_g13970 [Phytophthora fragariae]KAE9198401.1 hypothetical protein PF005_g16161 [Phytophthora fragariae]